MTEKLINTKALGKTDILKIEINMESISWKKQKDQKSLTSGKTERTDTADPKKSVLQKKGKQKESTARRKDSKRKEGRTWITERPHRKSMIM